MDTFFHLPLFIISFVAFLITKKSLIYGIIFFIVALLLLILIGRMFYIKRAVSKSLEANIETAQKVIKKENPDILIGSGWGAGLIVNLIERDLWRGNTILLSPSYYKVNKMLQINSNFRLIDVNDFNGKAIIYHSKHNKMVPFTDSKLLCKSNTGDKTPEIDIDLILLDRGDHDLNILGEKSEPNLRNDIEAMRNSQSENYKTQKNYGTTEMQSEHKSLQNIGTESDYSFECVQAIPEKVDEDEISECVEALPETEITINSDKINGDKNNIANEEVKEKIVEEKITVMDEIEYIATEDCNKEPRVHNAKDYQTIETEETPAPDGKWTWKFDEDDEEDE